MVPHACDTPRPGNVLSVSHEHDDLQHTLNAWFRANARPLPWRDSDVTPWGVLVSEFMSQQTQVDRVAPRWQEWMERWPTPADLAAAPPGEAVKAWDRLGYPRRALWLHRTAEMITNDHGGIVPRDVETLLSFPGVGDYTARAIAVFAYGERHPVVDTNTRRVLARLRFGIAQAGMPSQSDLDDLEVILPTDVEDAAVFNAAIMELGATVCTARAAECGSCPLSRWCRWAADGYPDNAPQKRPKQAQFEGSDRQVRGRIMALVRAASSGVLETEAIAAATQGLLRDEAQPRRALDSLIKDGLLEWEGNTLTLPL